MTPRTPPGWSPIDRRRVAQVQGVADEDDAVAGHQGRVGDHHESQGHGHQNEGRPTASRRTASGAGRRRMVAGVGSIGAPVGGRPAPHAKLPIQPGQGRRRPAEGRHVGSNAGIRIPLDEFEWIFARSGGPGGQNVNKVASKAVLRWDFERSPSVPDDVKARFRERFPTRLTTEGEVVLRPS